MAGVRKVQCVVDSVTDHGGQVYTVRLEPQERLPRFSAGQFLHLTLDEYDPASFWPESRVFSIASSPSRTGPLEILYSVKGRYTQRMEEELTSGKEVWVKLPYGDFVLDDSSHPRVLFAGGTGISAFSSLLSAVRDECVPVPVNLIFGIRNLSLFFYRELIETLARQNLCESISVFVEHGELPEAMGNASCYSGRIQLDIVKDAVALSGNTKEVYLAGPPAMLVSLQDGLRGAGTSDEHIHVDAWE